MSDFSPSKFWWERKDLCFMKNKLAFKDLYVEDLFRQYCSPSFFYNAQRVKQNIKRIHDTLGIAGLEERFKINYAMKANRFAPLLTFLKTSGLVGIDACSPNEVEHAVSCGFSPDEISFTATSLSKIDLAKLSKLHGLIMNCDSIHTIRKWGELGAGREIGIRINPAMGIGRAQNEKLHYSGKDTTKFGIYKEQFLEALQTAKEFGLKVKRIHFHTGCGYLTPQLEILDSIFSECSWFFDQVKDLETVNIGGGLGVPHVASDLPLDLEKWAAVLKKNFGDKPFKIEVEPGDYIVKDAGILLLSVNSIEKKRDTVFAGLNAGFNVALEPAVYGLPFQPVPAVKRDGAFIKYSLAGNINEALDIWYRDIELPELKEDDCLVLINAGAYSSSMASNHCMRGEFKEFLLI